jgi:formate hydrogenlyase subunit 5
MSPSASAEPRYGASTCADLAAEAVRRWKAEMVPSSDVAAADTWTLAVDARALPELCAWLTEQADLWFATLVIEETEKTWVARYVFCGTAGRGQIHVRVAAPHDTPVLPSISHTVHAADWHEREAEDLYGIVFEGHPRLGDFVLHDDAWQEGVAPQRKAFDARGHDFERMPNERWRPERILHEQGAFSMSVGPVYGGEDEAAQFLLETVGEDVVRAKTRLFYKYRGVEKLAEGRSVSDALLLAERFAGTTAVAHALSYCQAVERIAGVIVPPRAVALRILLAELERLRHHIGAVGRICAATGLAVATSQAAILEEDALRLSGEVSGHRYLFGSVVPGGASFDLPDAALSTLRRRAADLRARLHRLEEGLTYSSSFLDRLEGVGAVTAEQARHYGLVGPVARASGVARDLRRAQPYAGYGSVDVDMALEEEGDGYARLRVLFAEAAASVSVIESVGASLPEGSVAVAVEPTCGAALGWAEAPRGATFHWVRIGEDGLVSRLRISPPSFSNWHGFPAAARDFAFQDFPIIMATFGLSIAENDR